MDYQNHDILGQKKWTTSSFERQTEKPFILARSMVILLGDTAYYKNVNSKPYVIKEVGGYLLFLTSQGDLTSG